MGNKELTGYLLVDPLRHHRIFRLKYGRTPEDDTWSEGRQRCFVEDERPLDRVVKAFEERIKRVTETDRKSSPPSYLETLVIDTMASLACEDLSLVLGKMSRSLDKIELALHDDNFLQRSVNEWRSQLGRWRNDLFYQNTSLKYISRRRMTLPIYFTQRGAELTVLSKLSCQP